MRGFLWAAVIVLFVLPAAARSDAARPDAYDAANWARLRGCRTAVAPSPLHASQKLVLAAERMSAGEPLHASLVAAGYVSVQSSVVHLSGVASDADVAHVLAANYCAMLTDPLLSDMGAQRRGRDLWLVFAAPAPVPSTLDAAVVGRQILSLVNAARARARRCGSKSFDAAAPLRANAALAGAALVHSEEMAKYAEFDHRGHDGSSPATRVARAGYGLYSVVGENIAAGAMTPAQAMQGWLASPPHCENIMDPRFSETGFAFAVNLASSEVVYWTEDFAAPRERAPRERAPRERGLR